MSRSPPEVWSRYPVVAYDPATVCQIQEQGRIGRGFDTRTQSPYCMRTKGQAAEHPVEIHQQLSDLLSLYASYISIVIAPRKVNKELNI